MAARALLASAIALFCGCSPYGGGDFACTEDSQCGAAGFCREGFCSFADSSCDSGLRYGELSGPSSNKCVGDDSTGSDGGMDVPDMPPGSQCYGSSFAQACFANAPSGAITINAAIDTDTSPMCQQTLSSTGSYCVIAGQTITVSGTIIAVTGSKPVMLIATDSITVSAVLDASSHRATNSIGAGAVPFADTTQCNVGAQPGTSAGGGGGSFGSRGGDGGSSTGTGGAEGNTTTPTVLRGGCAGQNGNAGTPGARGNGGGAVYLYAGTQITINTGAAIGASGSGGGAGQTGLAGGGGGGSGGMIVLDAMTVTNNGTLVANGGGGGEGSGSTTPGTPGNEPIGANAAPATLSSSNGGEGGNGAAQNVPAGDGVQNTTFGGGGGGGGVGVLELIRATTIAGTGAESPAPS